MAVVSWRISSVSRCCGFTYLVSGSVNAWLITIDSGLRPNSREAAFIISNGTLSLGREKLALNIPLR